MRWPWQSVHLVKLHGHKVTPWAIQTADVQISKVMQFSHEAMSRNKRTCGFVGITSKLGHNAI